MVALLHDMMHKEAQVYIDNMITKSREDKDHVEILRKLPNILKKFQLKLKP